ncbi:MAG: glyoxylate/hydroxypyruvate reductase A [Rhodobacteraceae bacterium]|nr:glyoxylate/hydroxypyruvate reductase A [Paracoccaceae bacterium]
MSVTVLFDAAPANWPRYEGPLAQALQTAGVDATLTTGAPPEQVDFIVYSPGGAITDFTPYTRARAVLSLWAGVERIITNPTLTQPLARMVDPGMTEGMTEWIVAHTMRHHIGMDAHLEAAPGTWQQITPPLARNRRIGLLGLGTLGSAAALALAGLNFNVSGWSRRPRQIDGITCHSGQDGLRDVMVGSEILILLLPQTAGTEGLLNAETLSLMPRGASILNPGRGPLIDDDALLAALDTGQISRATLDVFRIEPLPRDHPFWAHPRVTVTPHIASETRPETAVTIIAENIRRSEAGEPLLHLVDRRAGY